MSQLDDIAAGLAVFTGWLFLAVGVRIAAGRALAWAWPHRPGQAWALLAAGRRGVRKLQRRGWSGRHGLPGALVRAVERGLIRVPEIEELAPRPDVADVDLTEAERPLTVAEQAEVDAMHAIVEDLAAENAEPALLADGETWLDRALRLEAGVASGFDQLAAQIEAVFGPITDTALHDALGLTGEYPIVREAVTV